MSAVTESLSRWRKWTVVVATVAALIVAVAACSSQKSSSAAPVKAAGSSTMPAMASTSTTPATGTNMVEVKNFSFTPMDLTVPVGTTVTWKFDDSASHTVTASNKAFSSPALNNGKTYSFTFTKAGTYPYICSIHQYMTGTITVS